jgi:hypothetical protein
MLFVKASRLTQLCLVQYTHFDYRPDMACSIATLVTAELSMALLWPSARLHCGLSQKQALSNIPMAWAFFSQFMEFCYAQISWKIVNDLWPCGISLKEWMNLPTFADCLHE